MYKRQGQTIRFLEGCRNGDEALEQAESLRREVEESEREAEGSEVKASNLESRADRASEQVAELRGRVEGLETAISIIVQTDLT